MIVNFSKVEPGVANVISRIDVDELRSSKKLKPENLLNNPLNKYTLRMQKPAVDFISKHYASSDFELSEAAIQVIFVTLGATSNNCLHRQLEHPSEKSKNPGHHKCA